MCVWKLKSLRTMDCDIYYVIFYFMTPNSEIKSSFKIDRSN